MDRYKVYLRDNSGEFDHRWSMSHYATSFGNAEEQTVVELTINNDKHSEIIKIEKDYE